MLIYIQIRFVIEISMWNIGERESFDLMSSQTKMRASDCFRGVEAGDEHRDNGCAGGLGARRGRVKGVDGFVAEHGDEQSHSPSQR